ncbi:MAG TPA: cytochrome P450 [Candidatus Binatus sp.]|uniref:cytochrome P450 n=1 Tax=Candidatus Binatus sp. TaxID=2811406 RepID=UPI002F429117
MSEAVAAQTPQDFYFNPWDENFRADPYPHYRPLLAGPPRVLDMGYKLALAARYADVRAILMDHATFSSVLPKGMGFDEQTKIFGDAPTMLGSDPPTQTRLRRLVSRDFTPRRIRDLEPRIREIAKNLIDAAERKGEFDVMADLANPLPVMVISDLLGVPPEEYQQFKNWSDKIVEADNTLPGMPIPDEIKNAFTELRSSFVAEIARRRKNPGTDLVSALVAAHDESEALNADELLQFLVLLLLAGNETTTNLIGNGMLALGRNPAAMAALRSKPELMRGAIEEMLRYDGPVQATFGTATKDTVVGGTPINSGMGAFVIIAAANRDPAQFKDPEKFDITRAPNDHVAFGEGIHFCIGAPLARMEGSIAIGSALERFPHLRLKNPDAAVTYKGSYALRGLSRLEMALK